MNPIDAKIADALRRQESAVEVTGLENGWITGYYDKTTGTIATSTTTGLAAGYMWVHKDDVRANNVAVMIGDRMWLSYRMPGVRVWVGYVHTSQRIAYAPLIDLSSITAYGKIANRYSEANTSNPPTDAELDSAFGTPASVGKGFFGVVNDNGAGTAEYWCWSDGTNWWFISGTKAT